MLYPYTLYSCDDAQQASDDGKLDNLCLSSLLADYRDHRKSILRVRAI